MSNGPNDRIIAGLHELGLEDHEVQGVLNLVNSTKLEPEAEPQPPTPQQAQQAQDAEFLRQLTNSRGWVSVEGMW
jgi:hypothetical protein